MIYCRYRYTNKHVSTKNRIKERSTCRWTISPTDDQTKHAKWMNATNMHLREQVSLSSLPAWKQGKHAKASSSEPRTIEYSMHFAMRSDAMIHHEDIYHPTILYFNMHSNNMNVPTFSCQVTSSHDMSHVTHISEITQCLCAALLLPISSSQLRNCAEMISRLTSQP